MQSVGYVCVCGRSRDTGFDASTFQNENDPRYSKPSLHSSRFPDNSLKAIYSAILDASSVIRLLTRLAKASGSSMGICAISNA